jgi:nucleoside-diphosphate-sugar epimerase
MNKKVLITGGAGFLGINLIRHLLDKDYEIVSLDKAEFDYPEKDKINIIEGDIRNEGDVQRAMEDIDMVVHCAAALPLYPREEIFSTDIEGTRQLLEVAQQKDVDRFVHISSTAVYGIPDHHPLYEDDKKDGVGPYGEAKVQAEEVCKEFRDQGMCIPIIRPKSFIGPERLGVFALLYDWAKDGASFPMIGSGDNKYQLLDVEDLCQAIYLTLTKEKEIVNDTYNIGAKEFTTMKEDFQAVLDEAGHEKRIIGLPAAPAIWILRVLEVLNLSPLYKWVYETAARDSYVAIEKAEEKLGFEPKYSNKDALIRNYNWYLENLDQFQGKSGKSHKAPWKQGALKIGKYVFKLL